MKTIVIFDINPTFDGIQLYLPLGRGWAHVTSGANKLGRSYLCVSEVFKLISVHLDIFYLITLGLTISKWGEPTLWVKVVKN